MKDGTMIHQFITSGKVLAPLCLTVLLLATACGGNPAVDRLLDTVDSLSNVSPDSALRLLDSALPPDSSKNFQSSIFHLPSSRHMRLELLRARCMNKAYVSFTTDSALLDVVKYYDRHGTPNEQMEAHYLLGCAYRDMGEVPHAVDIYLNAITKADTTSAACDYRIMGCIFAQMANMFHRQLLLSNEIEARKKAMSYAYLSGDTLMAISDMKLAAGTYMLLNMRDSAETTLKDVTSFYHRNGLVQQELQSSVMLMHLYSGESDRQQELKTLIDRYEVESDLFDSCHELPPSKRQYYYYRGNYFERVLQLDSAEYYYRKISRPGMTAIQQAPMFSGLLSVFTKRHQPDSISKYAQLYCQANDSSLALKDKDMVAQMAASYNYTRLQSVANKKEHEAYSRLLLNVVLAVIVVLLAAIAAVIYYYYMKLRRRREQELNELKQKLSEATEEYNSRIDKLQQLEDTHRLAILEAREALAETRNEAKALQKENATSQRIMHELNTRYNEEKNILTSEINVLTERIEALKQEKAMSVLVEKSHSLAETPIIMQIKEMEKNPTKTINQKQWRELETTICMYWPALVNDLKNETKIKTSDIKVCLLTALGFRPGSVANMTGMYSSQVTNIRAKINGIFFKDPSAATLGKNLIKKYDICPL